MFQTKFLRLALAGVAAASAFTVQAACLDKVVMVHGNTAYPSSWNNTVSALKKRGYTDSQIVRPSWGSKTCAACNGHTSGNLNPVKSALQNAASSSCTGKIDVIGHSMGVTLAMKAINDLGYRGKVNSFIGIAGAQHGLNSCGIYPYNVMTTTCGSSGLSRNSPLINSVKGKRYGSKMYSIKSYIDQVVCAGIGGCYVGGSHTSNIDMQNASYTYSLGHFTLQTGTTSRQGDLVFK